MGKTERIAWIHRVLQEKRQLSTKRVARQFEVSEKTVKRDIEYLRDRCDAPIVWNSSIHSYEYEKIWHGLDFLDEHSLLAASFLKAILGQFNYIPVVADALEESFLERLPKNYRNIVEGIVYELPQFEAIPDALVLEICRSLSQRRVLHIAYINANDECNERDIEPRKLVNYSGKWYTVAYDLSKKDFRTFALSRVTSFQRLETPFLDDIESKATKENVNRYVSSSYGIFMGEPVGTATLRFYGGAASNVRRTVWHPDQSMKDLSETDLGSALELSLPVHDFPELLGRALRCGASCEVVAPPEFRAMWKNEIEKMSVLAKKK